MSRAVLLILAFIAGRASMRREFLRRRFKIVPCDGRFAGGVNE